MSQLIVEVCKIDKIEKHPNADRLSIATVKGWHCIIGLNDYKEGDLVIYCPPDCVIPPAIIEQYNLEYLRKNGRVGTVKLRKCISQGLILPATCLAGKEKLYLREGVDVAKHLGITKYEPPTPSFQQGIGKSTRRKKNPLFDKYTEIQNIKNYKSVFKDDDLVIVTEKIHGTNFRAGNLLLGKGTTLIDKIKYLWKKYVLKQEYEFVYGSHNVQLSSWTGKKCFYHTDVYSQIAKKYNLNEIIPKGCILYGEIYGKGIQKGYDYGLKDDIDVAFFDVKVNGKYLNHWDFIHFMVVFDLPVVPAIVKGRMKEIILADMVKGVSGLNTLQKMREGCVIKTVVEENSPLVGRKVLKYLNPEYLLLKDRTDYK